ncbi:unnamed protein product [Rhizoctonia solani]|uniref:Uncharacterized protein n=1 Tax=Rhizoctonia solani TaxID=456999 RepID=A0A8H3D8W7_9AGAM|nr:unnamed protein product [Rhizoctonia solani]
MSTSPTPPSRSESFTSRLKLRNPARTFTLGTPRAASPSTTPGRATPTRSNTRDSSTPPPTTRSRSSIIPSAFQRRASATVAPSSKPTSTKASSSKAPSSEAVNELGAKTSEPSTTIEQAPVEAPKDDTSADVFGHARVLSGSTVESEPPMTPPPQAGEPISMSKSDDPVSDSPHDGASIASSRSPSRLRRKVSNISRHSVSGSIRRLSLLGPSSPPQVETAPVHAQGEMQTSLSRTPSVSSLRRHASPEPIGPMVRESMSTPEPTSEVEAPQPPSVPVAPPAPEAETIQPESAQPEVTQTEVPQAEAPPAQTETEAPKAAAQPEIQPATISTPPKEATPAPSVKAPSSTEAPAPKPAEPQTPVKPFLSRSASKSSLTRSPTPDRPEPKRRGTLANWARKSIDRRPSISGSRPASRGPAEDEPPSDTESVKERERKWGTGLPVPNPPTPKKSEDNIKRRFSLGRRQSESTKSPGESSSETDKKSGWSKMMRAVSKSKKEKEKGDGSSITPEASTLDVATEPAESRPSLVIPDRVYNEQRPLSAIVESPAVALNPHMLVGHAQSPEQVMGAPVPVVTTDSPVVVKAETTSPEMSPVLVNIDSDTSGVDSGMENLPALAAVAAEVQPTTEAPVVEEPAPSTEVEEPKDEAPAPVEEVQETPTIVEEAAAPEPETPAPPVAEATTTTSAPPDNLKSPMSPNSPASSPWDATTEREIARARSPRYSNGGPSTSNRRASPAPSIIGVKRKHPDEPAEVGKARVRYLPDWAVSPAIQLAVTLSLVLPRRKRDVANPSNRKRGGWWPLRRGTRTEIRFNAIRGVNEEVPIASKSWVVPAAVRTTAKVVTAPARRGDIEWGPVTDSDDDEDPEDEAPRRFGFSLSPSPEPDLECPR